MWKLVGGRVLVAQKSETFIPCFHDFTDDYRFLIIALLQSLLNMLPYFNIGSVYPTAVRLKGIHIMLFSISVFTITCKSLERLVSVSFPLTLKKMTNRKSAFILTLNRDRAQIPFFFFFFVLQEIPKGSENTNSLTPSVIKWTGEGGSSKRKIYVTIVIALTCLLPGAIAFIANVFLITVLLKRHPRRAFLFANRISRNDRRRFDDSSYYLWCLLR